MLEQELGRYAEMQARCAELGTVAARLGEDETPFVATLQALALLAAGKASADDALADALRRLRAVDDKSYLAYALNSAAQLHLPGGTHRSGAPFAPAEALAAASAMRRQNEITIARAMLARAGETASGTGHRERRCRHGSDSLSAGRGRRCWSRKPVRAIPTAVSTVSRQVETEQQEISHAPHYR